MKSDVLILFGVVFGSAGLAIGVPDLGHVFQPYLLYFMMMLLFLSFLRIDFHAFLDVSRNSVLRLGAMVVVKLVILPTLLYYVTCWALPEYAIPVLLLSGISTGVVAPFMATLMSADLAPVLRMVVVTSVIVPFSLPTLVKLLAGAEISISLEQMIHMLALVIFVPMILVVLMRKFCPWVLEKITARQFYISMVLFAIINLGVFSKYSAYFFQHPGQILMSVCVAYVLSVIYYGTGLLLTPGRQIGERLATAVSLALMNNVLVLVFSSRFFGPLSPTLAAMYMFPFYTMIVPIRYFAEHIAKGENDGVRKVRLV